MNPDLGTVDADRARRTLHTGAAVVLPNPAPLTYVTAATDPRAVNTVKGRPAEQAVALWAHDPQTFATLADALALDPDHRALAHRLLTDERVTLLVPLRGTAGRPAWLAPASQDGWALLFGTRWPPLLPVLAEFPILYVSSANRTGHPPAATAADAIAMFPPHTAVLGTGSLPQAEHVDAARSATTTLRLHPDGRIDLHRNGAQDKPYPSAAHYLDSIRSAHRSR
ncbi:Sua5/YciO/YrdC/YwlC family protein [Actinokineospora sp. NBRC 105648]|uniref:Sua5/YciO/YrdC/YwlC family protein n=1 Tax=Actinokineospora sp. NBRC 105648 TaxID=3032206 RepID=UPI0024A0DF20|nr:Sua5/YciO/YrdC/YwlC family protein [Actinokineospora sp. NBRC 105648]GLZ43584.1 hypothetical protein Acsp05_72080 [Actinokineospora sp. NBRC 105648]